MATARTPIQAPAKAKKRSKHYKKKVDSSSENEEEIEVAWKQVKSQKLREKCRKEKEEKEERRQTRTKGKQAPPREEPQPDPLQDKEMERDEDKKHITSQAEDKNDGYTTIDTDEENIEDTGGTLGEQSQAIQTVLQELHQQLALIGPTGAPREQTQWTKVPEAVAEIVISDDEEESKGKENQ
ncbi:uncharacterized protein [Pleurodeles waltl]|uniref:uncharacterized protein n=1 Tax=Pleurodeles waltl TaxID=8319 RepID=UPI0037094891